MSVVILKQFSKDEIRNYAITDFEKFKAQAQVRLVALGASALLYWVDLVKGKYSVSTSNRYLESLFWDYGNPSRIVIGIMPGTLATILEGGQGPFPLNPGFLKSGVKTSKAKISKKGKIIREGGKKYRRIPLDSNRSSKYVSTKKTPTISIPGIEEILQKKSPQVAKFIITTKLNSFSRVQSGSQGLKPRGRFVQSADVEFRTITPAKTWMHPGIRAALLGNQVSSWVALQREKFVSDILGGNSGVILPAGYEP